MSKAEQDLIDAMNRLAVTAAAVTFLAQMLVASARDGSVRSDVFADLGDACRALSEAQQAMRDAEEIAIVESLGDQLDGQGEGGMVS